MFKRIICSPRFVLTAPLCAAFALTGMGCGDSSGPAGQPDITPPAVSTVTPVDFLHIEVLFNEEVEKISAEHATNYLITPSSTNRIHAGTVEGMFVRPPTDASIVDRLDVRSSARLAGNRKVLLSLDRGMSGGAEYTIIVNGVRDVRGNKMTQPDSLTFTGTDIADQTPPEITFYAPAPNATGFGVTQSIQVHFSEPMDPASVFSALSWTGGGAGVPFVMQSENNNVFYFVPVTALAYNTLYTVTVSAGKARDWSGNDLQRSSSWSFRTTKVSDSTPPYVVSTFPADGAVNVPIESVLKITFSEAIDPGSLFEDNKILLTPDPGKGLASWTNAGKTLNFDPDDPLLSNATYSLLIVEGGLKDLAGNRLAASRSVSFSTGTSLPAGRFSGTIAGDPNSPDASNPQGAVLIASLVNPRYFGSLQGPPPIGGSTVSGPNGNYSIARLEDEVYFPFGVLDCNGDGNIDLDRGDALAVYGVAYGGLGTDDPDSVEIASGATVTGVDFPLYDPVAIFGTVWYGGDTYDFPPDYLYYVGVFDTTAFDPSSSSPLYWTDGMPIAQWPRYFVNEFEHGLADGTYYVGAYMDVDTRDGDYNPAVDPAGLYEVGGRMKPVTVMNGRDALNIHIVLYDPPKGKPGTAVLGGAWKARERTFTPRQMEMRRLIAFIKRALSERPQEGK